MRKIILVFIILILFCPSVFAHKVNIFAYVEGNTVYTEGYFPDGKKVKSGQIEVYDTRGEKLLSGETDSLGQFKFSVPKKEDLKIVLNASLGHRAEYTLKASEMGDIPVKEKQEAVSLRDVIAGMGYIFGITGIVMFILSKKNASAGNG